MINPLKARTKDEEKEKTLIVVLFFI